MLPLRQGAQHLQDGKGWDGWGWAGTGRTKTMPPEVSAFVQPAPVGSAPIFMRQNGTGSPLLPSAGC